jgi:hypothetical protein
MRYCEATPQLDVFSILSHEQAVTQTVKGINKLSKVIDWELFREELESVCAMPSGIGAREAVRPLIRC